LAVERVSETWDDSFRRCESDHCEFLRMLNGQAAQRDRLRSVNSAVFASIASTRVRMAAIVKARDFEAFRIAFARPRITGSY
jgi:hypothetical protein